jgi:hypothetical protein
VVRHLGAPCAVESSEPRARVAYLHVDVDGVQCSAGAVLCNGGPRQPRSRQVGLDHRPQSYLAVAYTVNTFSVVYIPLCSYIYMEQ